MRALSLIALLLAIGCGGGGRPAGPPIPEFDTLRTVSGQIFYFPTGPFILDRDANGRLIPQPGFGVPTIPRPAHILPIQVFGPTGTLLGEAYTDTRGNYTVDLNFGPNPATQVSIRVEARTDLPFTTVRVFPNTGAAQPYSRQTPLSGNPDDATMIVDIVIPLTASAPYHILESLYDGWIRAKSGILSDFPDVNIYWEPGNGAVSQLTKNPTLAEFTIAGGIVGDSTSNTDEWDPFALTRLQGEFVLQYFSFDTAPAGKTDGALVVPSVAWREGFLDFWACTARNDKEFWESEGSGANGRVTRFFNIESFFDPALGSLGPDDPNVYQDPTVTGIGSAFTVAEVLWDIHDIHTPADPGDAENIEFPLFLTLRLFETIEPGTSYPYLYTLFDKYVEDNSMDPVTIRVLLTQRPEDQGIDYPATAADETVWPAPLETTPITASYDETVSDLIDQINPVPLNVDLGVQSQRYYGFETVTVFNAILTLTTTGNLRVDLVDLSNNVVASGTNGLNANAVRGGRYVIRVSSIGGAQLAPYDLRVQLFLP